MKKEREKEGWTESKVGAVRGRKEGHTVEDRGRRYCGRRGIVKGRGGHQS